MSNEKSASQLLSTFRRNFTLPNRNIFIKGMWTSVTPSIDHNNLEKDDKCDK